MSTNPLASNYHFELDPSYGWSNYNYPTYTISPCGTLLSYTRTVIDATTGAVAPAFISNYSTYYSVYRNTPSNEGIYNFKILAKEPDSGLTDETVSFSLTLFYCMPTGFLLSPGSLDVSILGPSKTTTWSMASRNYLCGAYSVLSVSNSNYAVSVSGNNLTLSSPKTALVGSYSQLLTLRRNTKTTQNTTFAFSILVTPCVVTALTFNLSPISKQLIVGIDFQPQNIPFGTLQTPLCDN